MRPNFGAWRAQARWSLHQASQCGGEMVCLLIRTTAQLLIRMQDGRFWKPAHQLLPMASHWHEIQASKRRTRYVVAIGSVSAVLGCALGLKFYSVFHQTEIEQTDRAALDAIVKQIVDAGSSGRR